VQQRRLTAIGIVITIAVAALLVFLVRQPADAPLVEASVARYEGIEQTRTEDGFARLGSPAAPVTVSVFTSFASTSAAAFHESAIDPLIERVRGGSVQLIYVPMTLGDPDGSQIANGVGTARAAVCALEQGLFWRLTDTFFSWQALYGNQAYTNNRIVAGLDALGIDQNAYNNCLGSSRPADILNESSTDAAGLQNFAGMPTITINGAVPVTSENLPITDLDTLLERIDSAVATAARPAAPTSEAAPEPTAEVQATEQPTERPTAQPTTTPTPTATMPATEAAAETPNG
jgi:protein-disulfide isomerase